MSERRKRCRLRALKSAKLLVKSSVFDCLVRDLTNVGAQIEVSNAIHLPEVLEMTFDGGRSIRRCRIVWRTISGLGLEFL
jgi:hypothetical protein